MNLEIKHIQHYHELQFFAHGSFTDTMNGYDYGDKADGDAPWIHGLIADYGLDEIKPLLRPLSELTEEEVKQWAYRYDGSLNGEITVGPELVWVLGRHIILSKPDSWPKWFLDGALSRHYDINNLIGQGLAGIKEEK